MLAFTTTIPPVATTGERKFVKMGKTSWSCIPTLLVLIIAGPMTVASFGCGNENTPSETVDEFYRVVEEKDCQKVADLVVDNYPELADRYINDCKRIEFISHSIKGETFDSDVFAHVDVEVTIKENGVEKTNSGTLFLVKRGDGWKLTETENRSSKPPS